MTGTEFWGHFFLWNDTDELRKSLSSFLLVWEFDMGSKAHLDDGLPTITSCCMPMRACGGIGSSRPCIFTGQRMEFWGFAYSLVVYGAEHTTICGISWQIAWVEMFPTSSAKAITISRGHHHLEHQNEAKHTRGAKRSII